MEYILRIWRDFKNRNVVHRLSLEERCEIIDNFDFTPKVMDDLKIFNNETKDNDDE